MAIQTIPGVGLVVADDGLVIEGDVPGDLRLPAVLAVAQASSPEPAALALGSIGADIGSAERTGGSRTGGAAPQMPGGPASAGIGSLGLLAVIGLAVRAVRRRQARRAVEELVRRRLAGLADDAARGPAGKGAVGHGIGEAIVLETTRVRPP